MVWRLAPSSRSSSGFCSSSRSISAASSRLESWSSLMACCSCGVMTRDWRWRSSNLCVAAMSLNLLEAKPFAQVNAADVLVGDDFVWGAFHQNSPAAVDVGAVQEQQEKRR